MPQGVLETHLSLLLSERLGTSGTSRACRAGLSRTRQVVPEEFKARAGAPLGRGARLALSPPSSARQRCGCARLEPFPNHVPKHRFHKTVFAGAGTDVPGTSRDVPGRSRRAAPGCPEHHFQKTVLPGPGTELLGTPQGVPGTHGYVPGISRVYPGYIPGIYRVYSGYILGIFRV